MKKLVAVATLSLALAACAQPGQQGYGGPGEFGLNKTTGGGLLGAAAGGLAGAQIGKGSGQLAATAAGVLLGGLLGSQAGASLDRADVAYASRTTQRTLEEVPTGHASTWRNPDSGAAGTITPTRTYQTAGGQYCREFQQSITVGGKTEEGFGTACRQPDGSWRIVQ
jgi:surface antigen